MKACASVNQLITYFQQNFSEKHHQTTTLINTMSKSSAMSKAIHTIVICIMLTNFSIQENLETYDTEALNSKDITAQQLTVIEEGEIENDKG